MPKPPTVWIRALKEYNKDGTWCVPKKGTKEHEDVKRIMDRLRKEPAKAKMEQEMMAQEDKDAPAPKKTRKLRVAMEEEAKVETKPKWYYYEYKEKAYSTGRGIGGDETIRAIIKVEDGKASHLYDMRLGSATEGNRLRKAGDIKITKKQGGLVVDTGKVRKPIKDVPVKVKDKKKYIDIPYHKDTLLIPLRKLGGLLQVPALKKDLEEANITY